MTKEEITNKLKEYCNYELKCVEKYGTNANAAVTRCYGAVMFTINMGDFDEELGRWWDDEMLPLFRKIEMKGE